MLDLRIPIGLFFALIGGLLLLTAFLSNSRAPMGTEHVNLYTGLTMLAFGGLMLWLARRAR